MSPASLKPEIEVIYLRRQVRDLANAQPLPIPGSVDAQTVNGQTPAQIVAAPIYAAGSEPTPDTTWAGRFIVVTSASNPTVVKVCVLNSIGGYEWLGIAQSS